MNAKIKKFLGNPRVVPAIFWSTLLLSGSAIMYMCCMQNYAKNSLEQAIVVEGMPNEVNLSFDERKPLNVPIINQSDRDVEIVHVAKSCTCTEAVPESTFISAKGSTILHIMIGSAGREEDKVIAIAVEWRFHNKKDSAILAYNITAKVRGKVIISPRRFDFGRINTSAAQDISFLAKVYAGDDHKAKFKSFVASTNYPYASVAVEDESAEGATIKVIVHPSMLKVLGYFTASVSITYQLLNDQSWYNIEVPITCEYRDDDFQMSPSAIVLRKTELSDNYVLSARYSTRYNEISAEFEPSDSPFVVKINKLSETESLINIKPDRSSLMRNTGQIYTLWVYAKVNDEKFHFRVPVFIF